MTTPAATAERLPKANEPCWCGSGRKFKRCHKPSTARIRPGVVAAERHVPDQIERPPYLTDLDSDRQPEDPVQPPDVIEAMRSTGPLAGGILRSAGEAVVPGITTDDLDALVHDLAVAAGAYPSPLNYYGFPKSLCTSPNEVICHGIPDSRVLLDGDIVNLDVTVYRDGVHGDTNATFLVGQVDDLSKRLVRVTRECLERAIDAVRPGQPLSDIGLAIESHADHHGFGVVRAFVGHGIGRQFHSAFQVLHYHDPTETMLMVPGMVFTIEPMISVGDWRHVMWDDEWTAVTADGKRSAQFEHTLLVTDDGVEVLTEAPVP